MDTQTIKIPRIGYSLAADWYQGAVNEVILVLPGFMSNKANYAALVSRIVTETGVHALVLDYSGHGESPYDIQDISPAQNFLEVVTAFDWLKENHPAKRVTVLGTSYGGYHATRLTEYREFEKLIMRVPAIYPPDIFYTKWGQLDRDTIWEYRVKAEDLKNHPLLKRASGFGGKTFVITHDLDTTCPSQSTDPFTQAFNADTWEAKGFKHGFGESDVSQEQIDGYIDQIIDWMTK